MSEQPLRVPIKVINPLKSPFGRGKFSPVKDARHRQWDDAFEVEFADGLSFLEPHKTIRKTNRISSRATVVSAPALLFLRVRASQTVASWNQLIDWFKEVELLRQSLAPQAQSA